MHLLQSGVDITTIAAWLGHAQLATTHTYVEIDLRMKQVAIASASALPDIGDAEYPAPHIVDWLERLAAPSSYAQSMPPSPGQKACNRRLQPTLRITDRYG
jgi:hypothetical protein